jgi:integrase
LTSKKNRTVRVHEDLKESLQAHHKEHGSGERYFPHATHEWAFREAVEAAGLVLQEGQSTHLLRHTFASHFMMNGGNILALQKILGHQSLTMTMRYAHLAPDHLAEAIKLNPMAALNLR